MRIQGYSMENLKTSQACSMENLKTCQGCSMENLKTCQGCSMENLQTSQGCSMESLKTSPGSKSQTDECSTTKSLPHSHHHGGKASDKVPSRAWGSMQEIRKVAGCVERDGCTVSVCVCVCVCVMWPLLALCLFSRTRRAAHFLRAHTFGFRLTMPLCSGVSGWRWVVLARAADR